MTSIQILALPGVHKFIAGDLDWYDLPVATQDALYSYFADEMPYGIQKARTGDPDVWIQHRLEKLL